MTALAIRTRASAVRAPGSSPDFLRPAERGLADHRGGIEPGRAAAGEDDLVGAGGAPAGHAVRVRGEGRHEEGVLDEGRGSRSPTLSTGGG